MFREGKNHNQIGQRQKNQAEKSKNGFAETHRGPFFVLSTTHLSTLESKEQGIA
jgi:hypothetical protein